MNRYELTAFHDGNIRRTQFTADSYYDACWKMGVRGFPPSVIWSITPLD